MQTLALTRPAARLASHALAAALLTAATLAVAAAPGDPVPPPSFASVANPFADAPLVARVKLARATRIAAADTPATRRWLVEGDVVTLLRAPAAAPPRIRFLVDRPGDSGRPRGDWLVAARPSSGIDVQLLPDGFRPATPALETIARTIVGQSNAPGAPAAVTRISGAFHSAGTVPGESETQIFLDTASGKPASLSVLRRLNQPPAWSASFGEVVGDQPPPARDTLAWFRLACGLPAAIPAAALADLAAPEQAAARADYAYVRDALGPCR